LKYPTLSKKQPPRKAPLPKRSVPPAAFHLDADEDEEPDEADWTTWTCEGVQALSSFLDRAAKERVSLEELKAAVSAVPTNILASESLDQVPVQLARFKRMIRAERLAALLVQLRALESKARLALGSVTPRGSVENEALVEQIGRSSSDLASLEWYLAPQQ